VYVYLIRSNTNSYYKIGISKNPKLRLKQLQTASAEELELIETYESEFASKIEKALHIRFDLYKTIIGKRNEWFRLSLENELEFKNICEAYDNNFKILVENDNPFI
jgi:hypothetical protein